MNNTFTYIIRSKDKEYAVDKTNNCTMRLHDLPQQYKYFDCTVSALHISTISGTFLTSTFDLRATEGIEIVNGRDTTNSTLRTVALASYNNTYPQGEYTFRCNNFNGRSVRFQLYDDNNSLLQYAYNQISFIGTFTYVGANNSTITISNTSLVQLTIGQIVSNNSVIFGTITAQSASNVYVVTTLLTANLANVPMYINTTITDYNKPWILVLNMTGILE